MVAKRPNQYTDSTTRKVHKLYSSPNSLYVILPQDLAAQAKIKDGDSVQFRIRADGTICFDKVKVDKRKKAKA